MYREKIREHYDNLSRSYRKVADFILASYHEVSFMTAAELADTVGVDTTTVVRFAQRLGYDGYPELLGSVRQQVKSELYAMYEPADAEDTAYAAIFKRSVEQERHNLRQMLVHNPPDLVESLVTTLQEANKIYLIGGGYSAYTADVVGSILRHLGFAAETIAGDPVKRAITLSHVQAGDVVLGVSATDEAPDVVGALGYARARGAKTISCVGVLGSAPTREADLVIYAPSLGEGSVPSLVGTTKALSTLCQILASQGGARVEERIGEVNKAYDKLSAQATSPSVLLIPPKEPEA